MVVVSAAGHSTKTFFQTGAFDAEVEITHLMPKRNYSLQVYVRNQAGDRTLVQMPGNRGTFSTIAVPGSPSGLRARWESTNRMNLSWEAASSNGATIDSHQLFVDGKSHPVAGTTTSYALSGSALAELREAHAGGKQIRYSLRAVNRAGTGATSTAAFTLLNVLEGTLTMQLTSEAYDHVRVHLEYQGDDGYGRASHHADFGAPSDEVPLDLKCRVQLLSYGKPIEEKFVAMPMPGETIMEEFTELQNGVAYEVRAFPRNSVAEASGVWHSISRAPQLRCCRNQSLSQSQDCAWKSFWAVWFAEGIHEFSNRKKTKEFCFLTNAA